VLVVAAAVLVAEDPNEVVPDFVVARRAAGYLWGPLAFPYTGTTRTPLRAVAAAL
jgi:hypothetical protein